MKVIVQEGTFDPFQAVADYQKENIAAGKHGASVTFVGSMRDFNDGVDGLNNMYLDHYPGMTEKHIERVCQEALDQWDVMDAFVIHRVGDIKPDEAIVLVVVWSEHRAMAFDACRFIINDLKHRAPFWKRERNVENERWVEGNSVDEVADAYSNAKKAS